MERIVCCILVRQALKGGSIHSPFSNKDKNQDQRYARCLYGDTAVTVILDGEVLDDSKNLGITNFRLLVGAALEVADDVDGIPQQVAVLRTRPFGYGGAIPECWLTAQEVAHATP
jgi:hypothetical protein